MIWVMAICGAAVSLVCAVYVAIQMENPHPDLTVSTCVRFAIPLAALMGEFFSLLIVRLLLELAVVQFNISMSLQSVDRKTKV
ncbi:MAG: hypothetical protein JNK76_01795 [Planctomycetales bacterium]|nr:hypothetical protein [Planctomycetales bacterium]